MSAFILIVAVLVGLTVLYLLRVLRRGDLHAADRVHLSKILYNQRCAELKVDLDNEVLTQDQYDKAKEELDKQLLVDTEKVDAQLVLLASDRLKQTKLGIILGLPLFFIVVYLISADFRVLTTKPVQVGGKKQAAAAPPATSGDGQGPLAGGQQPPNVAAMIARVEARVKANPDKLEDWLKLLRAYRVLKQQDKALAALQQVERILNARAKKEPNKLDHWYALVSFYRGEKQYDKALAALQEIVKRKPNDAEVMVNHAVLLAESRNFNFRGKPTELLEQVLKQKPGHIKARIGLGLGYYQVGKYQKAIDTWEVAQKKLKPESNDYKFISSFIKRARAKLSEKPQPKTK